MMQLNGFYKGNRAELTHSVNSARLGGGYVDCVRPL